MYTHVRTHVYTHTHTPQYLPLPPGELHLLSKYVVQTHLPGHGWLTRVRVPEPSWPDQSSPWDLSKCRVKDTLSSGESTVRLEA